jgi:hypothetical protein
MLRVLAVLGLAVPVQNVGSFWAHRAKTSNPIAQKR